VTNFEERLLFELRKTVSAESAERGQRRQVRRLAVAGGLAAVLAAAVAAGVFFLSAGAQPAYAVTENADGTVTVEIDSLTDAAGLQAKLRAAGVNTVAEYLPAGKMCQRPWFIPYGRRFGGATQSGVEHLSGGGVRFTLSANIPDDAIVVIETQTGPGDETALAIGLAQGDVPPCQVVDAPAGSGPLGGPPPPTAQG
jgi:hypothetical protein